METLPFNIMQKLIALFYQGWVKLYISVVSDSFLTTKKCTSDVKPSYVPIFNLFLQPVLTCRLNRNLTLFLRAITRNSGNILCWGLLFRPPIIASNFSQIGMCICKLQRVCKEIDCSYLRNYWRSEATYVWKLWLCFSSCQTGRVAYTWAAWHTTVRT